VRGRHTGVTDDTPERMAADIQTKARGQADPDLLDAVCRVSGPAIDWLTDRYGLELELVSGPPASAPMPRRAMMVGTWSSAWSPRRKVRGSISSAMRR